MQHISDLKNDPKHFNGEPILRSLEANGRRIYALGGLHNMRGNSAPYFGLTIASWVKADNGRMVEDSFGAAHDEILTHWPDLEDLAALHLSDINGVPMHAVANGWYQLAGIIGGAGERYHAGNAESYGQPVDCVGALASHLRISRKEAETLAHEAETVAKRIPKLGPNVDWKAAKARFAARCEDMKPRWKKEAEACIAKHSLLVYGDYWKSA